MFIGNRFYNCLKNLEDIFKVDHSSHVHGFQTSGGTTGVPEPPKKRRHQQALDDATIGSVLVPYGENDETTGYMVGLRPMDFEDQVWPSMVAGADEDTDPAELVESSSSNEET